MKTGRHSQSITSTVTKETRHMTRFRRFSNSFRWAVCASICLVLGAVVAQPAAAAEPYKVFSFNATTTNGFGAPYTQAGGHLSQNDVDIQFANPFGPLGPAKDAAVTLPPGFFGNPAAAPRCPAENIRTPYGPDNDCPPGSVVGIAYTTLAESTYSPVLGKRGGESALYNVTPDPGFPAQFAFRPLYGGHWRYSIHATLLPRTESYALSVGASSIAHYAPTEVFGFATTFCSHGTEGTGFEVELHGIPYNCKAPPGSGEAPFLSNPVDCSEANPTWGLVIDSWYQAGTHLPGGLPDLTDPNWETATVPAPPVTGCDDPALTSQFQPTLDVKPNQGGGAAQADQPSGLSVDLDFPQSNDPTNPEYISGAKQYDATTPQAPEPKDITVKLPAGLSISPSSAAGLGACSDQASDPAGDQVHYDTTSPVTCPESSEIGTAVATSPLLAAHDPVTDEVTGAQPIDGTVYLLAPHPGDLPIGGGNQGGKFRLLIQLENARYGINFKLPGVATADPNTGQLTATFTDAPQLPSKHITVSLKEGPRAPLASPTSCGSFETTSDIVPWSAPGTPDAHPTANFSVSQGPNGTPCPAGPGARPFAPTMSAGTESSAGGQTSPFDLHLTRNDGEGELSSLEATLPKGLAAKFVGIPYCSDAALAAAAARSGREEQANPTCPASRIGSVTVGAGPGSSPFYAHGNAYLAGPYKGAPMSVAVITPAVAGPFDLGTVVVRNALFIEPETAQGRVVSDPFPKILDGVPLRLRSIDVNLDRPSFTLNPTNCSPLAINAKLTSTDGATATPSNHFQASNCGALGFKPQLKLSLKGSTKHAGHPALRAVLTYPKGSYANIASAQVNLPHSEFIDQGNLNKTCTKPVLLAGNCPASSVYGQVKAWTPLLEKPLEGPVYLVGGYGYKLPALVAELNGQIKVLLVGKVDSGPNHGIRNTFEAVPDAPVERFELNLKGGPKYSLLENSENLCAKPQKAIATFTAQNGMVENLKPTIANDCGKKKHHKAKGKKGKGAGHGKGGGGHKRLAAWLTTVGF